MRVLALAFVLFATIASAETLTGRVVNVADGDTLTLLDSEKSRYKVRLLEIDAPEKSQPYGRKSGQLLSHLVVQKTVRIEYRDKDRYGRILGRVYQADQDINKLMVAKGAAWAYRQYLSDASILAAEKKARQEGLGLWALPESEQIPPWDWRRGVRPEEKPAPADSRGFSCDVRKTCGQMSACAEAMFYLNTCGVSRLDRDNDGIPCESICP